MAADDDVYVLASFFDNLSVDVLANILAFLTAEDEDIMRMRSRRINKKVTEAVRKTIVPPTEFRVDNAEKCDGIRVTTESDAKFAAN